MEPSVRIAIREQNVCQGKTHASCSGKTQSSDVSRFFLSSKKGLKSSKVREVSDYFDSTLDRRLRDAFARRSSELSTEKVTKVVHALMKIVKVTADCKRPSIIVDGYRVTGMYPVSFEQAMSQCQRKISPTEMQCMVDAIPAAVTEFRLNGCLSEEWMDGQGIVNVNPVGSVPKDERALHQQRAVIFNHDIVQVQWDNYIIRNSAAVVEKSAAQKILEKEAAAEEKRIEKERAALLERERRNALSNEEKTKEKEERKMLAAAKKAEKAQKKADLIQKAKQTLGIQ